MRRSLLTIVILIGLLAAMLPAASAQPQTVNGFRQLTRFVVPGGGVAEIISATPDGNWLLYTNSDAGEVGLVDISNAASPQQVATIPVGGEPTSVSVTPDGSMAVTVVNTSVLEEGAAPVINPGLLIAIDLPSGDILGQVEIGAGPDAVATTEIDGQLYAVVAIENEPVVVDGDGNLTDEEEPGSPGDISDPGYVEIVELNPADISASTTSAVMIDQIAARNAGLYFPDDPQPEFVDIRGGMAAVSLQENNGIAVVDIATGAVVQLFSTGMVADRPADLVEDDAISFTDTYPSDVADEPFAGARFPDAIAWSADGSTIFSADEGEFNFTGGRGWSIWTASGDFVWDDGGDYEATAVQYGQYPEGRSENKGIEVEGIETGVYNGKEYVFVGSERGSFVAVYHLPNPQTAVLKQILPTGISPEGLLALPQRNLFLASEEVSGTITIFEGSVRSHPGDPDQPQLRSRGVSAPWSALSGLAGDPRFRSQLYAVPDNALPSEIYRIILFGNGQGFVQTGMAVTKEGEQMRYDLEGIAVDASIKADMPAGFWLASEGNANFGEDSYRPNLLVQTDRRGEVLQEIGLPADIDSPDGGVIRGNGFEGVTLSDDGRYLLAAIQREYSADEANGGALYTRIARYDLVNDGWEFFLYPLEPTNIEDDWIGLSEIVNLGGDQYAVIERDKQIGGASQLKKVYVFSLDDVAPYEGLVTAGADLTGHVIQKSELADVLDEFMPFEKVEGLGVTADGSLWAGLDNDGGEVVNLLVNLGPVAELP